MATAKYDDGEYTVQFTEQGEEYVRDHEQAITERIRETAAPAGVSRFALAVELLERAARLIGVPTTQEELASYIAARQQYDVVESSFSREAACAGGESEDRAREAAYREQFSDYCNGW